MDDCIIEGIDTIISDEEIVNNWDAKASRKIINKLSVCENEKVLDDVLRDYVWVLQNQALHFKMKKLLKEKIINHVKVFHLCCITTSNLPTELQSYWENMENVLVILCNLELDIVRHLKMENVKDYKEKIVDVTTKLIYILSVFLLNNNTRICHVLLKLNVRYDSRTWKDVMKVVYMHFLVMVPVKDKSEENFCRNYLLFQNYKKLVSKENHAKMDSVLFERFNMSPDIINKSRTLKKILLPSVSSVIDLVDDLTDCRQTAVDNYFKHIDKKNKDGGYIPFSINLESDSEDEVQLTGEKKTKDNDVCEIKVEDFVEEPRNYYDNAQVICVDDDSDVEEISPSIVSRSCTKASSLERTESYVSFLDSIEIPREAPAITSEEVVSSTQEEPPMSPENSVPSPHLPFLEHYLDNLKTKGQTLDTNVSPDTTYTVEEVPELAANNDNQVEEVPVEQILKNRDDLLLSSCKKSNTDLVSSEQPESMKTSEKHEEISSSDFNFISGLITPPISDRTNDDVAQDLNYVNNGSKNVYVPNMITMDDISYHQYESEIDNCATVTNSPTMGMNELGNERCTTDDNNTEESEAIEDINNTVESQENLITTLDVQLASNGSLDILEHSGITEIEDLEDIEKLQTDDGDDGEECQPDALFESESQVEANTCGETEEIVETLLESEADNYTHVDMVLDDYQLPNVEIRETVLSRLPSLPLQKNVCTKEHRLNLTDETVNEKEPVGVNHDLDKSIEVTSSSPYKSIYKIQASVSMGEIITGINAKISTKFNGNNISKVKPSPEKVIYTSSERVSAPLSAFSKFEQAQSELVENAFSGPIEPMYSDIHVHSDHSNSNDGHCFLSDKSQSKGKKVSVSTENSPISPQYEQIQAQEYENHIMTVDYDHLINTITTTNVSKTTESGVQNEKGINSRKRKLDETKSTEVRIIPSREITKLIEDEVLEEASESLKEYKIGANDVKLVYLQPQIPIKIESLSELQEKEKQLKSKDSLHNSTDRLNASENSCVLKRTDHKKITKQTEPSISPSELQFGHKISNLINKTMGESTRIDGVPSGYVPPVSGYSPVHGLPGSTAVEQKQTFDKQQTQTSNTFNVNCNSEILNLSVSSTVVSELDSPESEFSRSPKLLQNSDQIVQQCLIDNLDNAEIESATNVHNSITLLSNNSNFYSTPHQLKLTNVALSPTEDLPCQQAVENTDSIDKYRNDLDELLLKNELDKLFDDKLINSESEFSLPLKKRRVLPKLNDAIPSFKEEISYPATPMISIAEIEALHQNTSKSTRSFKTPAERKEMPPIPFIYNKNSSEPTPIITDQFNINNHTYNNPTINYHMNSVPLPFINVPCAPYYSFPPFLVPFNNVTTYDANLNQETTTVFKKEEEPAKAAKTVKKQKKDKKKQSSSKTKEFFEQFVPDKKFIF